MSFSSWKKIKLQKQKMVIVRILNVWAFPGLFWIWASFVRYKITILKVDNGGKWWKETGKKKEEYAPFYYRLLCKALHPAST